MTKSLFNYFFDNKLKSQRNLDCLINSFELIIRLKIISNENRQNNI